MNNQETLKQYNEDEIKQLLSSNEKLVYIDNGIEEFVARYEDLPDIIVDLNKRFDHTEDLKVYDFNNSLYKIPILTTIGYFLNKCDPNVRNDIIDRLSGLQKGEIKIKDYKVINEDILDDVRTEEEMER